MPGRAVACFRPAAVDKKSSVGYSVLVPIDQSLAASNIRRLAGMHLVSLDHLANFIGMSRPGLMRVVAVNPKKRATPSVETASKIADAFAIPLQALYAPPKECLSAALESFDRAPIGGTVIIPWSQWEMMKARGLVVEPGDVAAVVNDQNPVQAGSRS